MSRIKGIEVTLYEKMRVGEDEFKSPVYEERPVKIQNVLVSPLSSNEIVEQLNLHGKKVVYTLAIPKKDTHNWENAKVEFLGETWHTVGYPTEGIEELIPLEWNRKVMVERYG